MAIEEIEPQSSEKNPRSLKGSRPLRKDDIILGDEICEMEDHRLNFYLECWFNVDEVFGTDICTGENDDYLNVYADYDMKGNRLCDVLSIMYWRGDDCEECEYQLSDAEKAMLLPKIDAYCREQTGMSLSEYSASWIEKDKNGVMSNTKDEAPMMKANLKQINERNALQLFSADGDSRAGQEQEDFIKAEPILHKYKMKALESVLEDNGTSVEELLQDYLINLYSENVPLPVQQRIRKQIDREHEKEKTSRTPTVRTGNAKRHRRGGESR